MRKSTGAAGFVLLCLLSVPALAGGSVSIHLVRASNTGGDSAKGLEDIVSALKGSLVYTSYSLIGKAQVSLPARHVERAMDGYSVVCTGVAEELIISVRHGDRQLLTTTVALHEGKPLVLGGLPDGNARLVLVFTLR
ncbi:hypothetical protein ACFLSJ_08850 [Verrucomicrobiota bacterium]